MISERVWLGVGLGGQALFAARFILQWYRSERSRRSVVPVGFWYCSLFGGATLLVYAIHRRDIVFTIGQASGLFIYLRNLHLIRREKESLPLPSQPAAPATIQPATAHALSPSGS